VPRSRRSKRIGSCTDGSGSTVGDALPSALVEGTSPEGTGVGMSVVTLCNPDSGGINVIVSQPFLSDILYILRNSVYERA
jgi:hypothetical protein